MKRFTLILISVFLFACSNSDSQTEKLDKQQKTQMEPLLNESQALESQYDTFIDSELADTLSTTADIDNVLLTIDDMMQETQLQISAAQAIKADLASGLANDYSRSAESVTVKNIAIIDEDLAALETRLNDLTDISETIDLLQEQLENDEQLQQTFNDLLMQKTEIDAQTLMPISAQVAAIEAKAYGPAADDLTQLNDEIADAETSLTQYFSDISDYIIVLQEKIESQSEFTNAETIEPLSAQAEKNLASLESLQQQARAAQEAINSQISVYKSNAMELGLVLAAQNARIVSMTSLLTESINLKNSLVFIPGSKGETGNQGEAGDVGPKGREGIGITQSEIDTYHAEVDRQLALVPRLDSIDELIDLFENALDGRLLELREIIGLMQQMEVVQ